MPFWVSLLLVLHTIMVHCRTQHNMDSSDNNLQTDIISHAVYWSRGGKCLSDADRHSSSSDSWQHYYVCLLHRRCWVNQSCTAVVALLFVSTITDKCDKGFRCKSSQYCIAKELQCNGLPNCGRGDTSDETHDCTCLSRFATLHHYLQ